MKTEFKERLEEILSTEYLNSSEKIMSEEITNLVADVVLKAIGEQKIESQGKVLCNCDCPGPFCNDLIHPCRKPNKHYPQRDKALVDIRNSFRADIKAKVFAELGIKEKVL